MRVVRVLKGKFVNLGQFKDEISSKRLANVRVFGVWKWVLYLKKDIVWKDRIQKVFEISPVW